ncbi:putative E3 ubiquitin-protein ligase [Tetrabaena socialis]|uniref:Putative E3 ubiquitin-protein ligase n=1 Tax=Tetrabaena socialis TaxID=47790 RepID=A0A2J7ZVR0_9CHLO|nr:putative E3 ubiquitin-protein ligase [Tetrabaena socialis]|eukprot:PNH04367.1 putative E3 ubiquitin-protein ligase [Tetrabaena socialis]
MGCAASCMPCMVSPAAEVNRLLKAGDVLGLLQQLEACPGLLSTPTSVLFPSAGTPLHVACELKQVHVVQQLFSFLSCSSVDTLREALKPYCRRCGLQLPNTVTEGLRITANMTNCKGQTPLMYACAADSPELVKLLLAKDADAWAGDRCGGRTALHHASMSGSRACIEALMQHIPARQLTSREGVRYVNVRSICGLTPLHYAVFFDHQDAVRELLHHDPSLSAASASQSYDVFVTCDAHSTPLHFAAIRGNVAAVQLLLRHYYEAYLRHSGAGMPRPHDPRMRRDHGRQLPWQVAASHHPANQELLTLLHPSESLAHVLGAAGGPHAGAACFGAASLSAIASAALQAKLLGEVAGLVSAGGGSIGSSCGSVREDVAGLCPGAGMGAEQADTDDEADEDGQCGVCFARHEQVAPAGCGHGVCRSCAAELCPEVNWSLKAGDVRGLLQQLEACPGLLTSVLFSSARTPLHVACELKQVQVVQQLFSFLSCSSVDTLHEALEPYCRRCGLQLPNTVTEGLRFAANMANCKGQTPLMYACAADSPELVKLLLAKDADAWAVDRCGGRTALHHASMSGSRACIEALMQHIPARQLASREGVRYVNVRSVCGLTPLHCAVFFDHQDAVRELLHYDPDLNAASESQSCDMFVTCDALSTPLHFAAARGNVAAVQLLLRHYNEVAASHHPANQELLTLLHPSQSVGHVLGAAGGPHAGAACFGAASLSAIASAALQAKLLGEVAGLASAGGGPVGPGCGSAQEAGVGLCPGAAQADADDEGDADEEEDEEGQCCVCFARREEVAPAGCGHSMCGSCAVELRHGLAHRPPLCPICRQEIPAFVAARP